MALSFGSLQKTKTKTEYPLLKIVLDGNDFYKWLTGISALASTAVIQFVNLGRPDFSSFEEREEYISTLKSGTTYDVVKHVQQMEGRRLYEAEEGEERLCTATFDEVNFSGLLVFCSDNVSGSLFLGCYPKERFKECYLYKYSDDHVENGYGKSQLYTAGGAPSISLGVFLRHKTSSAAKKKIDLGMLSKLASITAPNSTLIMEYVEGITPRLLFTSHLSAIKKRTREFFLMESSAYLAYSEPSYWGSITMSVSALSADVKHAVATESGNVVFAVEKRDSPCGNYCGVFYIGSSCNWSDKTEYLLPKSKDWRTQNIVGCVKKEIQTTTSTTHDEGEESAEGSASLDLNYEGATLLSDDEWMEEGEQHAFGALFENSSTPTLSDTTLDKKYVEKEDVLVDTGTLFIERKTPKISDFFKRRRKEEEMCEEEEEEEKQREGKEITIDEEHASDPAILSFRFFNTSSSSEGDIDFSSGEKRKRKSSENCEKSATLIGETVAKILRPGLSENVTIFFPCSDHDPIYFDFPMTGGTSFGYMFSRLLDS